MSGWVPVETGRPIEPVEKPWFPTPRPEYPEYLRQHQLKHLGQEVPVLSTLGHWGVLEWPLHPRSSNRTVGTSLFLPPKSYTFTPERYRFLSVSRSSSWRTSTTLTGRMLRCESSTVSTTSVYDYTVPLRSGEFPQDPLLLSQDRV